MHVRPSMNHQAVPCNPQRKSTRFHRVVIGVGIIYLVSSLVMSFWFVFLLLPMFDNDLWWRDYNPSGHQALLVDLFNRILVTTPLKNATIDILSPSAVSLKQYTNPISTTDSYPSYVRRLTLYELTSIEYAVRNLRTLSGFKSMYIPTQYCWVDLEREYEVAHTSKRQQRCLVHYVANGAVYYETVLRNQDWANFIQNYGGDDGHFTLGIQAWLEHFPSGRQWLQTTSSARELHSVDEEIAYWISHNLTSFTLQWQNFWRTGISESVGIANALNIQQVIDLKSIALSDEIWSSVIMYWLPVNDFAVLGGGNMSLIRAANNSYLVESTDIELYLGLHDISGEFVDQVGLLRTIVGPFNSIDMQFLAAPAEMQQLYNELSSVLFINFSQDWVEQLERANTLMIHPTPQAWLNTKYNFHGGSPLCLFDPPQAFVQQPFGFSDGCAHSQRLSTSFSPYATILALLATQFYHSTEICALTADPGSCVNYLLPYIHNTKRLQSEIPDTMWQKLKNAKSTLIELNVSLIQFASTNSSWHFLHQPLLGDSALDWNVIGWLIIYEWTIGLREVVVFEGDESSLSLISAVDIPEVMHTSRMKITTATRVVGYVVLYVSVLLGVVALVCLATLVANRGHMLGFNLFWFNRIVGSSWIGRSLLLLRGFCAIVLLSSPHIEMVQTRILAQFQLTSRPLMEVLILSGEATWLVYVWNEVLTIITQHSTVKYAPLSCFIAWIAMVLFELIDPVPPSMAISRECIATNMVEFISCTVGVLHLGTTTRLTLLLSIQLVGCITAWIATCWYTPHLSHVHVGDPSLGIANVFVDTIQTEKLDQLFDAVTCAMAGHIHFGWHRKYYSFDVKLWVLTERDDSVTQEQSLETESMAPSHKASMRTSINKITQKTESIFRGKLAGFIGAVYAAGALFGSISYLQVTTTNLKNDMFWANFNMTGTHSFLGTWWNEQLILLALNDTLHLNDAHINRDGPYAADVGASIYSPAMHGSRFQHTELTDLTSVILGLRASDPTLVPWIYSQYCYVDFSRRWELANTVSRQKRCQEFRQNGAIFLESVLSNTNFQVFNSVWGEGYKLGIASALQLSREGNKWLERISTGQILPIHDEAARWAEFNITHYDTSWQNYKQIGLVNTYRIVNMLGVSYSLSLQYQNWTFRHSKQTTNKMYWGLANDFYAITSNTTRISGHSLVRYSPNYAFANTTPEEVLYENSTLRAPLRNSFQIVRSVLGPFGSVDLQYVSCPRAVIDAVRKTIHSTRRTLSKHASAQLAYFSINDPSGVMLPVPKSWSEVNFIAVGGSPLCPTYRYSSSYPVNVCLVTMLSWSSTCSGELIWAMTIPTREDIIVATILATTFNASSQEIAAICTQNALYINPCNLFLQQANDFVQTYMSSEIEFLSALASTATDAVRATQVELFHFGQAPDDPTSPLVLYRLKFLDEREIEFRFFAWKFLIDWALGNRDAIAFIGDTGNFTLLTELQRPLIQPVNLAENPNGYAAYMQNAVFYVTMVMILLAFLMIVYVGLSHGHTEVLNLLELQRVGAIVWIGRPLLFIRSITALGVLSTSSIELQYTGYVSLFVATRDPWYKTLLAVNEVTWLVAIVNDIAMVFTREYTSKYATLNSLIVWLAAASLSMLVPIPNTISVSPKCQMAEVDFQVICQSGEIVIGSFERFIEFVAIAVLCNVCCYLIARFLAIRPSPTRITSVFVYAGARYLYMTERWIKDDVYYMDRMSAALNGIITFRWKRALCCLDIKLWHAFKVDTSSSTLTTCSRDFARRAQYALPLLLPVSSVAVKQTCNLVKVAWPAVDQNV